MPKGSPVSSESKLIKLSTIVNLYKSGGVAIKFTLPPYVELTRKGISSNIVKLVISSTYLEPMLHPCNFPVSLSKNAIYPELVPTTTNLNSG